MQPEHGRFEDVRWLADTGETFEGAAARLGISEVALEKWLRRWSPQIRTQLLNNARSYGRGARRGKLTVAR